MASKTINLNEKITTEEEIENPAQLSSDPSPPDQAQNGVSDKPPPPSDNLADGAPIKDGGHSESTESPVPSPTRNDAVPSNNIDKKIRRAERFGVPVQLTEAEKRSSRAERFGTVSSSNKSEVVTKSEDLKRKARAERFGVSTPSVGTTTTPSVGTTTPSVYTTEEEAKKKARLARFASAPKTVPEEDDKRKARALRFSSPPVSSLSQVNGNKAIAGKATEGS